MTAGPWHHNQMKLFSGFAACLLFVSIACTAYKSAGSPSAHNVNAPAPANQSVAQASQERVACGLKISAAPAINGLRLGMTSEEILNAIPGSKDDPQIRTSLARPANEFGVSGLTVMPSKYPSKDQYPGISRVTFTFVDGHAYSLNLGYNGPKWGHVDEFVKKVIESSNLPSIEQWEDYPGMDTQMKMLKCAEFEVRVYAGGENGSLNYVGLKDLKAEKALREKEEKAAKP